MFPLQELIGVESELGQVSNALRRFAHDLGAPTVGACQVTCSDESECECAEAFQRWFVREVLPNLKADVRAPFRSINLGARYEWGAVRIAEQHFATHGSHAAFKLLVVKINAHVGVRPTDQGPEYGCIDRYGVLSTCCGALAGVFEGSTLPAVEELRQSFRAGGTNRLAMLADRNCVAPRYRALSAALVSAGLQAQRAVLDIQEYQPETPTVFLVLPCVSVNRREADTELVVGQYGVDRTGATAEVKYRGLGDDPAAYRVRHEQGRLVIHDDSWPTRGQ